MINLEGPEADFLKGEHRGYKQGNRQVCSGAGKTELKGEKEVVFLLPS